MFRVKICGITTVDDAQLVARAEADAVGLNFFPKSPRCITPAIAERIVQSLPEDVVKVGLFVNADADEILGACELLGLDMIQLHGDERPEYLASLGKWPILRAFRLGPGGLNPIAEYLRECHHLGCSPAMVLIDSLVRGAYGGSGTRADWTVASQYPLEDGSPPLALAGGLTADNVADAIRAVKPFAVDTASGVESSPGRKDPKAVTTFVERARRAFGDE